MALHISACPKAAWDALMEFKCYPQSPVASTDRGICSVHSGNDTDMGQQSVAVLVHQDVRG